MDIGCLTGIFLQQASQAGWSVFGLEPSHWATRIAAQRLPGANITNSSIGNAKLSRLFYDVITLWDVLEHLTSPKEDRSRIQGWLQPAGWLFLNTLDISSLPARLLGNRWVLFLRKHIWYFSAQTLAEILHHCGFKLVATHSNDIRFSLGTVIERLNQPRDPGSGIKRQPYNIFGGFYKIPL